MAITCDKKKKNWPNCVLESPEMPYQSVFEDACDEAGGVPVVAMDLDTTMICHHMVGVEDMVTPTKDYIAMLMNHFAVCAAPRCPDTDSDEFMDVVRDLAVDAMKVYEWLDCKYDEDEIETTIDLTAVCRQQFNPTGTICEAERRDGDDEDKEPDHLHCGFFTVLQGSTCKAYCENHGGECLYAGGFLDECMSEVSQRKDCEEEVFDEWCTCTFEDD